MIERDVAIQQFNAPDYVTTGASGGHTRMMWFGGMLMWVANSSNGNFGDYATIKEVDGILYEVKDHGRLLHICTPDIQVKYRMSLVDDIILGDDDNDG